MMKVLITGGSGFIGTNLCYSLKKSDVDFRIIDIKISDSFPSHTSQVDIVNQDQLTQSLHGDTIVHLAAAHRDDIRPISEYKRVNVDGTQSVCRAARLRRINRIIFTSSVAVYGFAEVGTDESGEIRPFNEYGRTKYAAEQVLMEWQREEPSVRSLTIIRPTVVFGPGNRGNVYNLFRQIASGRFVMIGDGTNRKSMAYVQNLVAFLEHNLNSQPGIHVYNYSDKPDLNMNQLVEHVRSRLLKKQGIGPRLPFGLDLQLAS